MRVLGIDHGERRIGAALSDALGIIASPLTVIEHTSDEGDADAVAALVMERDVEAVVVGVPISLDGSIGPQAKRAAYFARLLSGRLGMPVDMIDERLSTREAERKLAEGGRRRSRASRGRGRRGSRRVTAGLPGLEAARLTRPAYSSTRSVDGTSMRRSLRTVRTGARATTAIPAARRAAICGALTERTTPRSG